MPRSFSLPRKQLMGLFVRLEGKPALDERVGDAVRAKLEGTCAGEVFDAFRDDFGYPSEWLGAMAKTLELEINDCRARRPGRTSPLGAQIDHLIDKD